MERAQEFLTHLNNELDKYQIQLNADTYYRARGFRSITNLNTITNQNNVELDLRQIISCKAKIEAVQNYIIAVQSLRGAYWTDSQWHMLKNTEDNLSALGIKDNCVRYANIWD